MVVLTLERLVTKIPQVSQHQMSRILEEQSRINYQEKANTLIREKNAWLLLPLEELFGARNREGAEYVNDFVHYALHQVGPLPIVKKETTNRFFADLKRYAVTKDDHSVQYLHDQFIVHNPILYEFMQAMSILSTRIASIENPMLPKSQNYQAPYMAGVFTHALLMRQAQVNKHSLQ